jgi:hypothetical protein
MMKKVTLRTIDADDKEAIFFSPQAFSGLQGVSGHQKPLTFPMSGNIVRAFYG